MSRPLTLIPDPNEQSAHYGVSRILSHWDLGSVLV